MDIQQTNPESGVVTGLLGLLGIVLIVFGAVQAKTIWLASGSGAIVVALATRTIAIDN